MRSKLLPRSEKVTQNHQQDAEKRKKKTKNKPNDDKIKKSVGRIAYIYLHTEATKDICAHISYISRCHGNYVKESSKRTNEGKQTK